MPYLAEIALSLLRECKRQLQHQKHLSDSILCYPLLRRSIGHMFSDYKFPPLTSIAVEGQSWPSPDHLISPLTLDSDNCLEIVPVLTLDCTMDNHTTKGSAPVLISYENQRPIPKIVTETPMLDKQTSPALCIELPSPVSEQTSSPPIYTPQTEQSESTHSSLPSQDIRDLRRASIEHLNLGPMTEEGVNILLESDGIIRSFLVHSELLCHFSPYFCAFFRDREPKMFTTEVKAFNYTTELDFDRLAEDKAREECSVELDIKVKLPNAKTQQGFRLPEVLGDVKHAVFATFLNWLYLGRSKFEPKDESMAYQTLIGLWVLASRLGIPSCQNDCIAAIEDNRKRHRTIATSMLGWVYNNTRDYGRGKCGLKNLLIDQCALTLYEKWLVEGMEQRSFAEQFPIECLVDIIARMRVLLKEAGLGISLIISPTSRRYWVDGEGNAI